MVPFTLVDKFSGYRAKEDVTNLKPGYLVVGSQNVLTNEGERVAVRRGFTLDGQANASLFPIVSSYDWTRHLGDERHLRSWDDNLQYRYVDSLGVVTWRNLADSFSSVNFNWSEFWDTTEQIDRLLFVNGTSNIFDWSGGLATFASATATTITKQGVETWGEEGFYTAGTRQVVIDGVTYTYLGGEATTTITGVTPDPTLGGHAVGAVIHQAIRTTPNSSMTGIPATFHNDLIAPLLNYIYVGSLIDRQVYISRQNSFTDYTFGTPRLVGQGALLTLDATPVAFMPQEDNMYISAGKDQWYQSILQLSAEQVNEALIVKRLKTTAQQGAQSQALVSKIKNSVVYISFEPTLDELGRVENVETPQATNISDPIKIDFDGYDFTGGALAYWRFFILLSVPQNGVVRLYNLAEGWWEAPQTFPVGRFAIIDGELYGHSPSTPETYKLLDGVNDNGAPIDAVAAFSYNQYGKRANLKSFDEHYVEGYISSNTELQLTINYDINGCTASNSYMINGADNSIICPFGGGASLGKQSFGKFSLAGRASTEITDPPPKFRVIKTFPRTDFYEYQPVFSSDGEDQRWELLSFGPNTALSTSDNVPIKQ